MSPMASPSASSPHGVVVVDKPAGPTSHDVVDRVRRALGVRRVGHTGTLDPFATGVLAVCVGKATRLARFLGGGVKEYRATVRLGFATVTDDATGPPLGPARSVTIEEAAVHAACASLVGELHQIPPAYSAKHVGGRRLHEMARAGVAVERSASAVTVHAIGVISISRDRLELDVRCSTGTYVRALARDLGEALGVGGHLEALRRTRTGAFDLAAAVSWEEIPGLRSDRLIPMSRLLDDMPAVTVSADGVAALRHGRALGRGHVLSGFPDGNPPERVRVLGSDGESLLALAVPRGFGAGPPGVAMDPALHPDLVLLD
jgi:tRNA pseudouridine55 synthase